MLGSVCGKYKNVQSESSGTVGLTTHMMGNYGNENRLRVGLSKSPISLVKLSFCNFNH